MLLLDLLDEIGGRPGAKKNPPPFGGGMDE